MVKSPLRSALWLLLAWQLTLSAEAQSAPSATKAVRTQHGVRFTLPERFVPEPVDPALAGGITELSFVDGDAPLVRVSVARVALDGTRVLRALPVRSGPLPASFARAYIAGLQTKAAPGTAVTPGEYDANRHAFSARINGRSSSPAHILSRQRDDSPTWRELASTGGDIARSRCVLQALLKDGDNAALRALPARFPYASRTCQIAQEDLAAYVRAQRRDFFVGGQLTQLTINFVMPASMTVITVSGPPEATPELEQLLSSIWVAARVDNSAEHDVSRLARLLAFSDVQIPYLLGVVFGASIGAALLMALLAWLLTKLRAPSTIAVALPVALLLAAVVVEMTLSDQPSAYITVKLVLNALTMGLLCKPLQRWLRPRDTLSW